MRVIEVRQTEGYARWFKKLRDRQARARIDVRILLAGGDKRTQDRDIRAAKELAKELRE